MDEQPEKTPVEHGEMGNTQPVAKAPAQPRRGGWRQHLNHTGIYGFELLMATFGLTVAAIVIDYGLFAFFHYLKGANDTYGSSVVGEFSLWIVAAMLVWLPLAIVFYLRTRGQMAVDTQRRQATLHKVLVSIYQFVNVLIGAGALFVFLYSLIRLAVNVDSGETAADVLVRVSLPALLMVGLHGWLLFAYAKSARITRKLFGLSMGIIGIVVMLGLLVTSVGAIRGQAIDRKKEADLSLLSSAIASHSRSKGALPRSLDQLTIDKDRLELPLSDYTYRTTGAGRYELCTTFETAKNTSGIEKEYAAYASFTSHQKGTQCFKLMTRYSTFDSNYLDPYASGDL